MVVVGVLECVWCVDEWMGDDVVDVVFVGEVLGCFVDVIEFG